MNPSDWSSDVCSSDLAPMRIIPTGIEIDKFLRPDITEEMIAGMRQQLGIEEQQIDRKSVV